MLAKRVLIKVDLPRPDSPVGIATVSKQHFGEMPARGIRTDNHQGKLETLLDGLAVNLVRKVRKPDKTGKRFLLIEGKAKGRHAAVRDTNTQTANQKTYV